VSNFDPLREILPVVRPVVRPHAADELVAQWITRYYQPRPAEQPAQIWRNHFASVADYWNHKQRHPHNPAGIMIILCTWVPYILGTANIMTMTSTIELSPLSRRQINKIAVDDFIRLARSYHLKE